MIAGAQDGKVTYGAQGYGTTAPRDEYKVSYGHVDDGDLDLRYGGRHYARPAAVVPASTPLPRPVVLGHVKPYSDTEYGSIVLQALKQDNLLPETPPTAAASAASAATPAPSKVAAPKNDAQGPALTAVTVTDLLDRGVLVTADGEQLRLRGVAVPSVRSKHEMRRDWATSVTAILAHLVKGRTVYITVESPEKGLDGRSLVIMHLRDGTEVNRLMLESGLGIIAPGDFSSEETADPLIMAESDARKAKRGIWKVW
jgi:endonuclease YncB( thermonuclease family)